LILSERARSQFLLSKYVSDYLDLISEQENIHRTVKRKDRTEKGLNDTFNAMQRGVKYAPFDLRRMVAKRIYGGSSATQSMPTRRVVREALALRDDIRIVWDNGVKLFRA
jgi:hypothetical protein